MLVPKTLFDRDSLRNPIGAFRVGVEALPHIPFLESASSTNKVAWGGLISDVLVLQSKGMLDTILSFLAITGQKEYFRLLAHIRDALPATAGLLPITSGLGLMITAASPIGKLSLKEEAAGKVRVFAMVTIWDQIVLKPLHDMLFRWLKTVPNDATFDQEEAVARCMTKAARTGNSFGYDLSAATDRLPVLIQRVILNKFIPRLGDIWSRLLTDRDYVLSPPKRYASAEGEYRYAVGQPMGALSSWAMLAVTHHLLAQLAAHRFRSKSEGLDLYGFWTRWGWYTGYEVLGDDIVIFEEGVALEYLSIMEDIGVPINLKKSVVAKNDTFEFAKVTGHKGNHVAALSWAMFMAQPTVMGRVAITHSLLRKPNLVRKNFIRYVTVLARESKYTVGIPNLFYLALGTMFANAGKIRLSGLIHQVITYRDGKLTLVPALFERNYGAIIRALAAAIKTGRSPSVVEIPAKKTAFLDFSSENLAIKIGLVKTIKSFVYGSPSHNDYRVNALQPSVDAMKLAKEMVLDMICYSPEGREALLSALEAEGAFSMKPKVFHRLSPIGVLVHPVYCYLFSTIYEQLVQKWVRLTSVKPLKLKGLSLEELMAFMDDIDRYKEILELPARRNQKLSLGVVPPRNLIDSPLDVLVKVLKAESNLGYMRDVVLNTGVEVITKIFAGNDTAFYSIFTPEGVNTGGEDNPGYRKPLGSPSLAGIRAYMDQFGEEFVRKHLPKWGKYAAAMFNEPKEFPEFTPWNPFMAQPDYLYSITMFSDYLNYEATMSHHSDLSEYPIELGSGLPDQVST